MWGFAATCSAFLIGAFAVSSALMAATPRLVATRIAVTANGARSASVSSDETRAYCARFKLDKRDVREYFTHAGRVDSQAYNHDLDMSRCHAAGNVQFTNSLKGYWTIDQARRGLLRLENGKQLYFYCVDCTSRKFDPLGDEDRQNGRALIRASTAKP